MCIYIGININFFLKKIQTSINTSIYKLDSWDISILFKYHITSFYSNKNGKNMKFQMLNN